LGEAQVDVDEIVPAAEAAGLAAVDRVMDCEVRDLDRR
jgi:hypothetical protein